MTGQTVADGKKQSGLPDEQRGQLDRRIDELKRRLNQGTLDFQRTMDGIQPLIEDKIRLIIDLGVVTHLNGRHFRVEVYEHARYGVGTSSEKRLAFLTSRGGTLLGRFGLELLGQQGLLEKLPRGFWYASFEQGDNRRSSFLMVYPGGGFSICSQYFGGVVDSDSRLLCFVEVK